MFLLFGMRMARILNLRAGCDYVTRAGRQASRILPTLDSSRASMGEQRTFCRPKSFRHAQQLHAVQSSWRAKKNADRRRTNILRCAYISKNPCGVGGLTGV